MKAAGAWTWWNEYGSVPLDACVQRVVDAGIGVIVKAGYWHEFEGFKKAGVPVAVERYVYPNQPAVEVSYLAEGMDRGASFIVINAEVEWESLAAHEMEDLLRQLRRRVGRDVELYASIDSRGDRTGRPHQRALAREITAWMPMVYPLEFRPHRPAGFVRRGFTDCLDAGQSFAGKPVLPTIQAYHKIGPNAVIEQVQEAVRRGLPGVQAYTICHATNQEWAAFVKAVDGQWEDDMPQLWLVKERGSSATFITNGVVRAYVADRAKLQELQDVGIWPDKVTVVPKESLSAIPRVDTL